MDEVPQVEIWTETTDDCGSEASSRIWANMRTRMESAGWNPDDGVGAINCHIRPNGKVYYVHIVTLIPPDRGND